MTAREHPTPPFPKRDLRPPGVEARMDPRPRFEAPAYRAARKLVDVALSTGGASGRLANADSGLVTGEVFAILGGRTRAG
jgi:hypothetical protein